MVIKSMGSYSMCDHPTTERLQPRRGRGMGTYDDPQIRDILLPYARAHLTTDHVQYTEQGMEQILLDTLATIPLADATSFLLPTDPFEALAKHLNSLDSTPFQERWSAPQGAIELVRDVFPPLTELKSEMCCLEPQNDLCDNLHELYRPLTPVLTQRSRRETPKLGCTGALASIPRTTSSLQSHLILRPVAEEVIIDPPTPEMSDVLDVRYKLDAASQKNIRSLLQEIYKPRSHATDGPHVANFLRSESPTSQISLLDSPPLFARDSVTNSRPTRTHESICERASDVDFAADDDAGPTLERATEQIIEEEEGGLHDQHMQVVNGWCAYVVSSPPSYHSDSSSNNGVDELWDMSPPGSPPTSLAADMMEEIEIPRTRMFGRKSDGHRNTMQDLSGKSSAGAFIASVVSPTTVPAAKTQRVPPLSPTNSMFGQPPSTTAEHDRITNVKVLPVIGGAADADSETDLDVTLTKICASSRDPVNFILEERLDEKDVLLMDVPTLQPPTKCPRKPFPQRMENLVVSQWKTKVVAGAVEENDTGTLLFLKPVKGLKALSLGLSWVPFKFGGSIPTDEEVALVDGGLDLGGRCDDSTASAGYAADGQDGGDATTILRGFEGLGASPTPKSRKSDNEEVEDVLARWERDRLANGGPDEVARGEDRKGDGNMDGVEINQYGKELDEPPNVDDCSVNSRLDVDHRSGSAESRYAAPPVTAVNNGGFGSVERPFSADPSYDAGSGGHYAVETDEVDIQNANRFGSFRRDEDIEGIDFYLQWASQPLGDALSMEEPMDAVGPVDRTLGDVLSSCIEDQQFVARSDPENRSADTALGISREAIDSARATKRRKLDRLVPTSARDLFATFIGLRNKGKVSIPASSPDRPETPLVQGAPMLAESPPRTTPNEVIDQNTVLLPPHWVDATTTHRYMASLSLIQKRALVRELQGNACRVILVERCFLGGCDIILDPDRAIIVTSLFALPAQIEALAERISKESWRYSEILVVFEAYPSERSCRAENKNGDRNGLGPYAYSPPIVKAIKRLRRIVSIAEGCGTKDKRCLVVWAFANGIEEAARVVRCFGEEACTRALQGANVLWGEREWLEEEETEGEADLAEVEGMNAFAAYVMLYGRTVEDVLDMSSESRMEEFGELVGKERVETLNRMLEKRTLEMRSEIFYNG
ncbi:hypothetical protein EV401DRAFT_2158564 [Pisolithus croceorrhizus]|nr:hypothetical protein EV401DRAFT_2158564 [Pisolithus croceorrhizus]